MKTLISALTLCAIAAPFSAFASGTLTCTGTREGKSAGISVCTSQGIKSLCGNDISVTSRNVEIASIPAEQAVAFYSSPNVTALAAYDETINDEIVTLEYFGEKDSRNKLVIKVGAESYEFTGSQVTCSSEE